MTSAKTAKPADVTVGQNIRIIRLQRGLSQGTLGEKIGVTFQQVQKYEKGANRVGASRLTQIAGVLGVTIPALFEGVAVPGKPMGATDPAPWTARALLANPHAVRLLTAFDKVDNDAARLAVLHLVESLVPAPVARRKAA